MTMKDETDRAAMVVGASRGLGHGIARALAASGTPVVAVARSQMAFDEFNEAARRVHPEIADATDPAVADALLDRHDPQVLVLVAGASPLIRPLQEQTWRTFSVNWETDVRMAFHWLRAALRKPLAPGSRVIVMSSGAALQGSPLSGGYAGAKATQRFMAAYAQEVADRAGQGIRFASILPRITPATGLGRPAVAAYAARNGQSEEQYMQQMGPVVTPETAGSAVLELVDAEPSSLAPAYLLTGAGLNPLPTGRR